MSVITEKQTAVVQDQRRDVVVLDQGARQVVVLGQPGPPGSGGDMLRATYDPDGDGKVLAAETADSVPWAGIEGKPTLGTASALNVPATGDATTGEVVTGSDSRLSDARPPTAHSHAYVSAVSAAAPLASTGGATPELSIPAATAVAAGHMTAAQATKLDGIAAGATANDSDTNLKNRANHTGTQPASTISDFNSAALAAAPAETVTTVGALIGAATEKTPPVDTDMLGLMDSATGNVLKKFSWANLKGVLETHFAALYALVGHNHTGTYEPAGISRVLPCMLENGTEDEIQLVPGVSAKVLGPLDLLSFEPLDGEIRIADEYGWSDITAEITVRGSGANNPAWTVFRDGIYAYEFSPTLMKEAWLSFHPNHNFAPGTEFYLHVHLAPNNTGTGVIRMGFEYTVAKGHGQGAGSVFPATTTLYVEFNVASPRQYEHLILETGAITDANFEVDSLCLVRVFRDAAHANDTFSGTVHVFTADIHHQVSRFATKNRAPNFYL